MGSRRVPGGAADRRRQARGQQALVLNPTLLVPPVCIDAPQYAFVGPLQTAAHLRARGVSVRFVDAFLMEAPERLADGWLRLGPDPESLVAAATAEAAGCDLVVVGHPPWARLERNLAEVLGPLLGALGECRVPVVLADAALGEAHYVRTDPAWVLARFPGIAAWAEREPEAPLDAWLEGAAHPRLHRRAPATAPRLLCDQVASWHSGLDLVDPARYGRFLRESPLAPLAQAGQGVRGAGRRGGAAERLRFPILTSRGCPFHCSFCTSERGRPWVARALEALAGDLDWLAAAGIEEAVVLDPIANAQPGHFRTLLEALEARGLRVSFPNGLRADRLGPGEIGRLARLADAVPISVETANREVMRGIGKGLALEAAERTLRLAHEVGLPVAVHYVIGLPGESGPQVNETLAFAFRAREQWGAEPLVQAYVPPERLAVPGAQGRGLDPSVYGAFGGGAWGPWDEEPTASGDVGPATGAAELPYEAASAPGEAARNRPRLPARELGRFVDSVRRRLAAETQAKLVLNVSYRCNNRCVFCSVGDRARVDGRLADQRAALERAASRGVRLLDIDGGEPTLYRHLRPLIAAARDLGFETITVTTNGRMLLYEGLTAELARQNVQVLVSLHGPSAAVHEALTRAEGSFAETLRGIEVARRAGVLAGVNTTVVRQNLEALLDLRALLAEQGVPVWNVQALTPFGEAIGRSDLAPPWEALRPVLRRLLAASEGGPKVQLVGLPPCWQEEVDPEGLDDYHKGVRQMLFVDGTEVNLGAYLERRRRIEPDCAGCARRLLCGGQWDFETAFEDGHREGPAAPPRRAAARPGASRDAPAPRPEGAAETGRGPREPASPAPAAGRHRRDRGLGSEGPVRLLDLIPGYACNVQCDYCSVTPEMRRRNLTFAEILPLLRQGRAEGITALGIGGGEPTIRRDFLRLVSTARELGYRDIKVQTNGLRFADPEFSRRAVEAGVTRVHVSLMTCRPALFDRITGLPGSYDLVARAVADLAERGVTLAGDLIVKRDTVAHLDETVAHWHARGVTTFYLWLVSLSDRNAENVASLRPVSEWFPHLARAFDWGRAAGVPVLSRHIPACQLPGYGDHVVRLGDEDVWVVTPDASFWLLESAISANRFVDACGRCRWRGVCWGVREDYLARFGDAEIAPLAEPPPPRPWERGDGEGR